MLLAALTGSCWAQNSRQQQPPSPIQPSALVATIWRSSGAVQNAMAALDPGQMHLPKTEKHALVESQQSIARNLREAVPGLVERFQAEPENLGAAFRLYRDLEAVLLVAQRSGDTLPPEADGVSDLLAATDALRASLDQLAGWIETRGSAQYSRLHPQSTAPGRIPPTSQKASPPPPDLIINNANAPAPAKKKH